MYEVVVYADPLYQREKIFSPDYVTDVYSSLSNVSNVKAQTLKTQQILSQTGTFRFFYIFIIGNN